MRPVFDISFSISSIPVINKIGHSSSGLRKTVWLILLIVGLFQSGLRINRFLHLYFQYPVVISLDIEEAKNLIFPAVTFCNLNRMKEYYQYCNAGSTRMRFCKPPKFPPEPGGGVHVPERKSYSPGEKYCSHLLIRSIKNASEANDFLKRFFSETDDNRRRLGYQSHELIRDCTYDGTVCSSNNFTQTPSLQYGNCYTFNISERISLKTHDFGAARGFQVVLSINPDNYLSISHTLGAKVIIHNPEGDPDPDEAGIIIRPGFETSIALRQTVHERLPSPYRDRCVKYSTGERPGQKSQMECTKTCVQKANYATCGCLDPTLLRIDGLPLCNIANVTESCCQDDVLRKIASEEHACDCPLACSTVFYNERVSMSVWPSEKLFRKDIFTDASEMPGRKKLILVRNGYARVKIFYSTFKRSTYSQRPMFQQPELYSYLGGELGLWLGLSVATLFEMVELFLKFFKWVLLKITAGICI